LPLGLAVSTGVHVSKQVLGKTAALYKEIYLTKKNSRIGKINIDKEQYVPEP
jgi:hypothetical protein